ncbi:hypothetical protein ACI68E_002327 [Malassezia pachydermatis]
MPLDPAQLRVHPETGYLYHPSPVPPRRQRRATSSTPSPYGAYSLVASHVVLQHFAETLEIDIDQGGGSVVWQGQAHRLALLDPHEDLGVPRRVEVAHA